MNKQYRFQLISPVVGEKIYQTNSIKKGVRKCYDEFKCIGINNHKEFCVMDTISYETYKFSVNNKNIKSSHIVSNNIDKEDKEIKETKEVKEDDEEFDKIIDTVNANNINYLYDKKIDKLENRVKTLENKIKIIENNIKIEKEYCKIM